MAPEYAMWGYLTYKADVYSFGIVSLEIVSGKNNMSYVPAENCYCVLDWVSNSLIYVPYFFYLIQTMLPLNLQYHMSCPLYILWTPLSL